MRIATESLPEKARFIARRLRHGLAAEQIYLFGSQARGDADSNSDLDFFVVVPDSTKSRYERAVEARGLVRDILAPKDIIVLTRAEWEREIKAACSLSSTVLREGIPLHDEP